jgi:uncharacterized protein
MPAAICPACSSEMTTVQAQDVTIDQCSACKGIWFDDQELDKLENKTASLSIDLLRSDPGSMAVVDHNRPRNCPRCGNVLLIRCYYDDTNEVEIDQCVQCSGVWLDPGELNSVRGDNAERARRSQIIRETAEQSDQLTPRLRGIFSLLFR